MSKTNATSRKTLDSEIAKLLNQALKIGVKYYRLTGKPLGITGEIGEYRAATLLGLKLMPARSAGYDAKDKLGKLVQIKSRCIPIGKKITGQRLGAIKLTHDWHYVLLVLMDTEYRTKAIYRAERADIIKAINRPGGGKGRKRGALSIPTFRSIGRLVWSPEES